MIKYKCDMCRNLFNGVDIKQYKLPRKCEGYSQIHIAPTHLCKDCVEKIADMFREYRDEDY